MGLMYGPGSIGEFFGSPASWWDHFKNGTTNDVNLAIANENLAYQKERARIEDNRYAEETEYNRAFAENERDYNRAFAEDERQYNRTLQQQIFNREDTALERQAEQLSKLGINPLSQQMNGLGAGQAVSSPMPSPTSAPSASTRSASPLHNDFQMQDVGNMSAILSLLNSVDNINTNGEQRDLLREQADFQRLQNQAQAIENDYLEEKRKAEIEDIRSSSSSKRGQEKRAKEKQPYEVENIKATAERNERENQFQKDWNVTDNTNSKARAGVDFGSLISTSTEKQKEMTEKSPLSIIKKTLTNSAESVANAVANTFNVSKNAVNNARKKAKKNKSKFFYSPQEFEKQYSR